MGKFSVILERLETTLQRGTVTLEAETAEEARRIIRSNLELDQGYYDNHLKPAERVIGDVAIAEDQHHEHHGAAPVESVLIAETGAGKFQNSVAVGHHRLLADEPASVGGLDSGPSPYDFLAIALGSCTSMTLRLYADHRHINLGRLTITVTHGKVPVEHCCDCGKAIEGRTGKIDRFERVISAEGGIDAVLADRLVEIANKCPVHRTLGTGVAVVTRVADR